MAELLPLWMFVVLTILLMAGYPVAFTLGGVALTFGLIGFGFRLFELLPLRIWGTMTNQVLLAVPLFVFMGVMLERSGLAEDLIDTMALCFGRIRGGLAVSIVVVGALLAASTGIVGATVVTMGLLALPTMLRRGYRPELATGTIAASGTLGQIIPPSIVLVIVGDIVGVSVGNLFVAALLPGFALVALYIIYILVRAFLSPEMAPPIPQEELAAISRREFAIRVGRALIPPAFLMVAVLGSIFFGIASPTEAAAMGASGAMLLAFLNRKLTYPVAREVMIRTTRLTTMVFTILVGASAFGLTFRGLGGDGLIRSGIAYLPFGAYGLLAIVMTLIFLLGFFLDFIEITFIHVPVIAPILIDLGIDPIWFCILLAVNLQTSFLTPPFGYALFYLKSVSPREVTTGHIYRGIIPFVTVQLVGLMVVAIFPELATWLPAYVFGRG
ncbi:MAG: TRAP transporter large permease subunit [Candidatus Methylomirabilia bacterium]